MRVKDAIHKMLVASSVFQTNPWVIQDSQGLGEFTPCEIQDVSVIVSFAGLIEERGIDLVSAVLDCTALFRRRC